MKARQFGGASKVFSVAQVAAFADGDDEEQEGGAEMTQLATASSGRQAVQSRERRLAERLSQRLSMYWRREDLHDKSEQLPCSCESQIIMSSDSDRRQQTQSVGDP